MRRVDVGEVGSSPLQEPEPDIDLAPVAPIDQVRRDALGASTVHRRRQQHNARALVCAESLVSPAVRHVAFLALK